ncbi:ATP-dependent DNA ligase [Paenibacillus koleovorans]|uniref:ATP-dependent DNA ligase n=1 Tax=Paenibacillus koleovorans TaxID=121608 RepID=UPI000FDB3752|nr:RNA ligase family protein [Paenibacillus koleovorans]
MSPSKSSLKSSRGADHEGGFEGPVQPFEPISTDVIPVGPGWVSQIKWDGVRMLTYYDGETVQLVNRRLNDRTMQYPEFHHIARYCSASSVILDGELIAFDQKKPSFHEIMKRDSLRKQQNVTRAMQTTSVTYMLFDVLYVDGRWVTGLPLSERQRLLQDIIRPQPDVQLTQNFPDGAQLLEAMRQHGMEGVVAKELSSTYAIGGKDKRWVKKKLFYDITAVVGGVTYRDGTVNALLLGLYGEQGLVYIGHAGAGKFTVEDWRRMTAAVVPLIRPSKPFVNEPERSKEATWVEPRFVVKVQYMEWTPYGTMRHPGLHAVVDVPPEQCTFQQG